MLMSGLLRKYKDNYVSIIRLGLPILIGQLGMIIVGFADNIMVGQYSTEALASASFVNNIFNVAILACIGFTYGLTPLVGALFSQKRYDTIGAILRNGLFLNTAFSLIILGIMTILYFNVDKMGQPEELLPLIRPYYQRICSMGLRNQPHKNAHVDYSDSQYCKRNWQLHVDLWSVGLSRIRSYRSRYKHFILTRAVNGVYFGCVLWF